MKQLMNMKKGYTIILLFISNYLNAQFSDQISIDNIGIGSNVILVDLNMDGEVDILSSKSSTLVWYINQGNCSFSDANILRENIDGPEGLNYGDFDNDGDLDIIAGSFFDKNLFWYENNGNQEFLTSHLIAENISYPKSTAVGDIDGDGFLDIVTALIFDDKIVWYANDGVGNFSIENIVLSSTDDPVQIRVVDLDQDDDLDVIAAIEDDGVIISLLNDGEGNFNVQNTLNDDVPNAVNVNFEDIDGDNDIDVFYTSFIPGVLYWNKNDGTGNLGSPIQVNGMYNSPLYIEASDMNNDNLVDLIIAEFDKIRILNNDGEESFVENTVVDNSLIQCRFVTPVDIDSDGDQDLVANINGQLVFYKNSIMTSITSNKPNVDLDIFPNPATDMLRIKTQIGFYTYTITDSNGKIILNNQKSDLIDISNLSKGIYFCSFRTGEFVLIKRFVKL